MLIYSDDCLILCKNENNMNNDMKVIKEYLNNIKLSLNNNKTVIIKRYKNISMKYLGINIKLSLSLTDHIEYKNDIMNKRLTQLRLFWRKWNINLIDKIFAYKNRILPILSYDTIAMMRKKRNKTYFDKLEILQRRVIKGLLGFNDKSRVHTDYIYIDFRILPIKKEIDRLMIMRNNKIINNRLYNI